MVPTKSFNKLVVVSFIVLGLALVGLFIYSISTRIRFPQDALSVKEFIKNPSYDTNVKIYGQISRLEEMLQPSFELTYNDKSLVVWYALMAEDDGSPRPSVIVDHIKNGDWVVVTGELKSEGIFREQGDFWAQEIENLSKEGMTKESETNIEIAAEVCETDLDCVHFGETGECNCGCYLKEEIPTSTGGECFCQAPILCECIQNKCEGIFE